MYASRPLLPSSPPPPNFSFLAWSGYFSNEYPLPTRLQDPNDFISYICAWLALVPQAIIIVYVTLVWSTREAEVCLAFVGQLVCEGVNFVLKRIIKEERPQHHYHGSMLASLLGNLYEDNGKAGSGEAGAIAADGGGLGSAIGGPDGSQPQPIRGGYGMPSSHAQFAGFWALTIALFLLVRYESQSKKARAAPPRTPAPWHKRTSLSVLERVAASIAAFIMAFFIAWSRVYLHYHTPRQVLVGFAAGLIVGAGWFVATAVTRHTGLLAWGLSLPPAQYLRFRDLALDEDVLQAGWEKWKAQQAAEEVKKNA
jgi:dolichyldiphosphatase